MKFGIVTFPGSNCDYDAYRAVRRHARRRRRLHLAQGPRSSGRGRRHPARRIQLRRLPARRRHRALQSDHERGRRTREARRAGARHLQRLPDRLRGRPAARRAAAQPELCSSSPHRSRCGSRTPTRCSRQPYEPGQLVTMPVAHGDGRYTADEETLDTLESEERVVFRYVDASGECVRAGKSERLAANTSPGSSTTKATCSA